MTRPRRPHSIGEAMGATLFLFLLAGITLGATATLTGFILGWIEGLWR